MCSLCFLRSSRLQSILDLEDACAGGALVTVALWKNFRPLHALLSRIGVRSPKLSLGEVGERLAEQHLKRLGYRILERRYRIVGGELDLVAVDDRTIVFVEVKTRRAVEGEDDPSTAVDYRKQRVLTRAAMAYLKQKNWLERRSRFDVISVKIAADPSSAPDIRHFINAFEAS